MPAIQFPIVPIPPKLTDFADANTRIYFDCNVTPIPRKQRGLAWKQATPDSELVSVPGVPCPDSTGKYPFVAMADHEYYARLCGLTPTMQIYNQTADQATMWSTNGIPDVLPMPPPCNWHSYNTSNGNAGSDYMATSDPAGQEQMLYQSMKALATLTHFDDPVTKIPYVTLYGGLLTDQYMPIIFDFESSKTFNGNGVGLGTFLSPEDHLARSKRWRKLLKAVRDVIGYSRHLYSFQYNGMALAYYGFADLPDVNKTQTWYDIVAEEEAICRLLSGFCPSVGYMSDVEIRSPAFWYQHVINSDSEIDKHYPQWRQSKIIYINPYYQPSTSSHPLYAKLVPMPMWETQIKFLVARGWSMLLWIGDMSRVASYKFSEVKPYIDYLARYQK